MREELAVVVMEKEDVEGAVRKLEEDVAGKEETLQDL